MKIVIVDDDMLVAGALKTILEAGEDVTVVGTGQDGSEAFALYRKHLPDVLLMDIRMRHVSGLDAAKQIVEEYPEAKILLLTTFADDEYIVKALKYGVKGYLLKQDYQSILPAIRAVCTGQTVFGTEIVSKIPQLLQEKKTFDWGAYEISPKELKVISLVAEGLSNKEIAGELFLSEGTVRNYISNILEKMGLRDRTQLAVYYLKAIR
ncbi:response regulator [Lachnospiraceae bacterium WCA-9-b2]|jgi:Response regulator containing a CheY-like receiver domain and an HTH DNA-binding domain|uniref:Stage 0 sporulation protein A homolog n=1 Tax=Sporofaciens musculi TaxID=2681861 RepID=A0A7X3MFX4_9FIRM|nr:response regulator transcription factor [Sporofaciens musculi]MCI9422570.1 response regulator transcription factor [Dorea sp.]MXP75545.1 response regulator [Sporofaciens musculi]